MNSKDFYPHTVKSLSIQLGCAPGTVNNFLKKIEIGQTESTYLGAARHFMPSVLDKLKEAGCGSRRWNPKPPKEYNGFVVEKNIPYTTTECGLDKYPFHLLDVGESFVKK